MTDLRRSDLPTVNLISVFSLIQNEPGNEQDIIGKILMSAIHIFQSGKTEWETVDRNKRFQSGKFVIFVCDQPGDEVILINQMVSDRSKLGGYGFASCDASGIVCETDEQE
ncbi:hypothetical protein DY000_02002802 [Brassica cretica]|uniref:Uncharacterized protein n=1 Tax=Brassica cretica TaxID=69181 RepID=A0ABQ7C541_BRACR|nr:hypothetical protein DY000_02002802 [Brassica cretica]